MTDTCLSNHDLTRTRKAISNGLHQISGMLPGLRYIGTTGIRRIFHTGFALAMIGGSQVMAQDMEFYPDLVGKQLSSMQESLDKQGISLLIKKIDSPIRRGQILEQIPPDGSDTPFGPTAEMYLVVSDGLIIPDVIGLQDYIAKPELERMGFSVKINKVTINKNQYNKNSYFKYPEEVYIENTNSIRSRAIAYTIPPAGTRIDPENTIVTIRALSKVRIPRNILYYSLEDLIKDPNISYYVGSIQGYCDKEKWFCRDCVQNIISSFPAPGEIINIGTSVRLSVKQHINQWCEVPEMNRYDGNMYKHDGSMYEYDGILRGPILNNLNDQ